MISDHEQRALDELERGLRADDPRFASSFHSRAQGELRKVWITLAIVVGAVLGLLMLATGAVGSFFALLLGVGVALWARRSFQDRKNPPRPPA